MRGWIRDILISLLMGAVVPAAMLHVGIHIWEGRRNEAVVMEESLESVSLTEEDFQTEPEGITVKIRLDPDNVVEMDLEAYLCGAVLAEMPASFEIEALKAQSVAARTFALRSLTTGGKHGDGSVCTQASCCQAYISREVYLEKGGAPENADKIELAVESTAGLVLLYEEDLIEATYFSCSGGRTEDASAVWGSEFPYLRSVESPGEEFALHYTDTVAFSVAELETKLGVVFGSDMLNWFSQPVLTEGGGVDSITIAGIDFSGMQLRQMLGLRSTAFSVETDGMLVSFTTRGYGHRVGMSQYGAEAMALEGADYGRILSHYYPGTLLQQWE